MVWEKLDFSADRRVPLKRQDFKLKIWVQSPSPAPLKENEYGLRS